MKLPGSGELDPELDARLVARCIDGDARSWEALVRRHERLVYSIGRSYRLGDEDMADVFQDVFTALLKGLPRLRDGRTLVRWLSSTSERIARTTALKRRREAAREDHADETFASLADQGEAVGADLEKVERQHQVRLALGAVSERCKRLLEALRGRRCPGCGGRVRSLGEILATMRSDRVGEVPRVLHERAVGVFVPPHKPSLVRGLVDGVAELLFDSSTQPLTAAARRSVGEAPRLRFKLGTHSLDLEIEREGISTLSVRGRFLAPDAHMWSILVEAGPERR